MPTKVHVTDESKKIAEAYQAFLKSKGYDITQAACIEMLLLAGYKSKTGKDYKPKGRG